MLILFVFDWIDEPLYLGDYLMPPIVLLFAYFFSFFPLAPISSLVSIPSVFSSIRYWPRWLRPAQVDIPGNVDLGESIASLNAEVMKRRPLIYVYDLPPQFNSLLLEMAIYESILASPYRTLNGEEADFFLVPVLDSCIITSADDSPHLSLEDHRGFRTSLALEFYRKAYDHIAEQYPSWNQSSGKDHIWFFSWDEGACYAPKEIWSSMMLVHWGNTNLKHNHSTTAYRPDNWDDISPSRRGSHPCFDPKKDIVLPAWKRPDENSFRPNFGPGLMTSGRYCFTSMGIWVQPMKMAYRKLRKFFMGTQYKQMGYLFRSLLIRLLHIARHRGHPLALQQQ